MLLIILVVVFMGLLRWLSDFLVESLECGGEVILRMWDFSWGGGFDFWGKGRLVEWNICIEDFCL